MVCKRTVSARVLLQLPCFSSCRYRKRFVTFFTCDNIVTLFIDPEVLKDTLSSSGRSLVNLCDKLIIEETRGQN